MTIKSWIFNFTLKWTKMGEKIHCDFDKDVWELIDNNDLKAIKSIQDFNPNLDGPNGTCLQQSVSLDHVQIVQWLLEQGADSNLACQVNPDPPIFISAKKLHLESFQVLVDHPDTNVDTVIQSGSNSQTNLLHQLIWFKYSQISWSRPDWVQPVDWYLIKTIYKMLDILFKTRLNQIQAILNEPDLPSKNTPLLYATWLHGQEIIKLLLEHGAEKSLFKQNHLNQEPINMIQTRTLKYFLDKKITFEGF
jgi:hypothetical protein